MSDTYAELKAKAAELMEQAEKIRKAEKQAAIDEIRAKMTEFGLTGKDLGIAAPTRKSPKSSDASDKVIRYRNAEGETWSGGPGRKPEWVRNMISNGQDIEQFRIAS